MKTFIAGLLLLVVVAFPTLGQKQGDVIINEIGNSGTKRALYTGGDYVELLILKPGGVKLAGWYLTDITSVGGEGKDNEGAIKFSDKDSSIFLQTLPEGTYVVICLGSKDQPHGATVLPEDASLSDGNNMIVVYAYGSPKHIEPQAGRMLLTGKDNVALLSSWEKTAAVDVVRWEGASNWLGCTPTELPIAALDNGMICYFVPKGKTLSDFQNHVDPALWKTSSNVGDATPGRKNPGVDDAAVQSPSK
jgi:hypothetical protein